MAVNALTGSGACIQIARRFQLCSKVCSSVGNGVRNADVIVAKCNRSYVA